MKKENHYEGNNLTQEKTNQIIAKTTNFFTKQPYLQ